jgi:hypothetical protein
MKAFHALWRGAALILLVAGSLAAVVAVPFTALIALAIASTMAIGITSRIVDEQRHTHRPVVHHLKVAAPGLVIGPALGGVIGALGIDGLLLIAVLAATSPWVVGAAVRRYRKHHPEPEPEPPPLPERIEERAVEARCPAEPADLPDEQLFNAWQLSYVLLQHARTTPDRIALVTIRQRYLDELERRNPDGFRLWMANGARAASNPRRYLSSS